MSLEQGLRLGAIVRAAQDGDCPSLELHEQNLRSRAALATEALTIPDVVEVKSTEPAGSPRVNAVADVEHVDVASRRCAAVCRADTDADSEARLYDCRHTFATWAIESGVQLSYLAVIMGASVVQIEDTYSRWLKRTDEQLRAVFDAYDQASGSIGH